MFGVIPLVCKTWKALAEPWQKALDVMLLPTHLRLSNPHEDPRSSNYGADSPALFLKDYTFLSSWLKVKGHLLQKFSITNGLYGEICSLMSSMAVHSGLGNLKELQLADCSFVYQYSMLHLISCSCPQLESLVLKRCSPPRSPNSYDLQELNTQARGLESFFAAATKLCKLDIQDTWGDVRIHALPENLTALRLSGYSLQPTTAALRGLQELVVEGGSMVQRHYLLYDWAPHAGSFLELTMLTKLTIRNLYTGTPIWDAQHMAGFCARIGELRGLRHLGLEGSGGGFCLLPGRFAYTFLCSLKQLTYLDLRSHRCLGMLSDRISTACGSNGLLSIAELPQLVVLDLRGTGVTDLSPLSGLRGLQCLVDEPRRDQGYRVDTLNPMSDGVGRLSLGSVP